MRIPIPKKLSQFPIYMVLYWLIIWGIIMIYMLVQISLSLTPDGRYVEKIGEGKTYFVPVGYELINAFAYTGITVGIISMTLGYYLMYKVSKGLKRKKRG